MLCACDNYGVFFKLNIEKNATPNYIFLDHKWPHMGSNWIGSALHKDHWHATVSATPTHKAAWWMLLCLSWSLSQQIWTFDRVYLMKENKYEFDEISLLVSGGNCLFIFWIIKTFQNGTSRKDDRWSTKEPWRQNYQRRYPLFRGGGTLSWPGLVYAMWKHCVWIFTTHTW